MSQNRAYRFDEWVLRADLGELSRDGRKVRLQDQPLLILEELLAHPGELVTREQLIAKLWPKGVVDFEVGLNSAVRKLRVALEDAADSPRYIVTVPRKGYRFIGKLDSRVEDAPPAQPVVRRGRATYFGVAALLALVAVGSIWAFRPAATGHVEASRVETANVTAADRTLALLPLRASNRDDTSVLLAQTVTQLIRERLATLDGLTVIAASSTEGHATDGKLKARYLLGGSANRAGERLLVELQMTDVATGKRLWSTTVDPQPSDIGTVREEVARRVARELELEVPTRTDAASEDQRIDLDAYQLYVRGQQLLSNHKVGDAETAIELFQRATILNPRFARAFMGFGQAKLLKGRLDGTAQSPEIRADIAKAFERALRIDPSLGEAWIEQARLTADPAKAETLYRRGIELAPNYGVGQLHYAEFLFDNRRLAEALEMMDRARAIDPLTPSLHVRQAFFVMVARSDVATHRRLLREALEINPEFQTALLTLAYSHWEHTGEFAEAAALVERAVNVDPQSAAARSIARDIYLDLADGAAARSILVAGSVPAHAQTEIAQYERDPVRAAALLRDVPLDLLRRGGPLSSMGEALRDGAIASGNFASTLARFETASAAAAQQPRMWNRGFAVVHAHALVLAGEVERGRRLAESTLAMLDTHDVGRAPRWFSRERASAFAVLGEDERALDELEQSVRDGKVYRWWYLSQIDPLFARVRRSPRFAALNEQAKQHIERQRALREERRAAGGGETASGAGS